MIETLAGTRTPGFNGDGLPAAEAELHHPCALTIDGTGNLYLADRDNWRVRRIDPAGTITTVAGSGLQGHAGDGGLATGAELGGPSGLALDGAGSLYVAEYHNHRVRNIDATGIISTAAGTGEQGFRGDGRLAVEALLDGPAGVVADTAGNLFVSDCGNHRVRRIGPDGAGWHRRSHGELACAGRLPVALDQALVAKSLAVHCGSHCAHLLDRIQIANVVPSGELVHVALQVLEAHHVECAVVAAPE